MSDVAKIADDVTQAERVELLSDALNLASRIESAGPAYMEAVCGNVDRWKATARELAPRLRAHLLSEQSND